MASNEMSNTNQNKIHDFESSRMLGVIIYHILLKRLARLALAGLPLAVLHQSTLARSAEL